MSVILGSLEELILLSMRASRGQGAVTGIREDLKRAGVVISGGAIDRTLRRLEIKGLVDSSMETPGLGWGRVRSWSLTPGASEALDFGESVRKSLCR